MDGKSIVLDYPLRIGDIEHKEIKMRRPTIGDMAKCQNLDGYEHIIRLISQISGVGPLFIELMDLVDVKKCSDFLDDLGKDTIPTS